MTARCSIIIPVYNAFDEARLCLQSVLRHSAEAASIIVIDDASPQGMFKDSLPGKIAADNRLVFRRNQSNLGFVSSCNLGMQLAGENDVILLNSDTEVTAGWAAKLRQAAYSREIVATVTPLTNNGTICSFPRFCEDNRLPSFCSLDELAAAVERVSQRSYPELPTCIGFCVYIKREVLLKIGAFDAATFGRGYGEENDFSCRAHAAGWVDILDDATFVYHKGNMSFKDVKSDLSEKNSTVMQARHPYYFDEVARFCNRDAIKPVRLRILDELTALWNRQKKRRILQIVHNGPFVSRGDPLGGTEMHVQDIINAVPDAAHWSLVPSRRCYFLTAHLPGMEREYVIDLDKAGLRQILDPALFDLVHLHHSRWLDHAEACAALIAHGSYIISFHDYILVCPRFHLYTPYRRVCRGQECHAECGYGEDYIKEYRTHSAALLAGARRLICFSDSTRDLVEGIQPGGYPWKKIPHGMPNPCRGRDLPAPPPPSWQQPLKVVFLGHVPQHKGSLIIEEMISETKLACGVGVEWHVIGKLFLETGERVVQHGQYRREELPDKLKEAAPHVAVILSICPETYCLTLDEAWNAGVPVVVTPYGAPAERMRESGAGWLLEELSPKHVLDVLNRIAADPREYEKARSSISKTKILSIEEEAAQYRAVYAECCEGRAPVEMEALGAFLGRFGLAAVPQYPWVVRLAGKVAGRLVWWLDGLGLRVPVQKWAYRMLPHRLLGVLKRARF